MDQQRLIINCVAPEQLSFLNKYLIKREVLKQLRKLDLSKADITGDNPWLCGLLKKMIPDSRIITNEMISTGDPDYLLAVWDGDRDTENPIFHQITSFVEANSAEKLIQIIIKTDRKLDTEIEAVVDSTEYEYDIFLSACSADAKRAKKISRMIKSGRAPRSVAKKIGRKRIKSIYHSFSDTLTDEDVLALKSSKIMILICSETSEESDKNRTSTTEFSKFHGRKYIYTALISGIAPGVFPPALMKEETYTDPRTGEEVKMAGEPLAANFTKENKRQHKREIMRLLAPVFGCTFDDLVRRHLQQRRNYLFRFATAVAAVGAVVTIAIGALASWEMTTNFLLQQSLSRLEAQEAEEKARAEEVRLKLQEAEEANAEARFIEAIRLTMEAEIAFSTGNTLLALNLLIDATPEMGVIRRIPQETESLLRRIFGQSEVIALLRLTGVSNPVVDGDILSCMKSDGSFVHYDLTSGMEVRSGVPSVTIRNESLTFPFGEKELVFRSDGTASIYLIEPPGEGLPPQEGLPQQEGLEIMSFIAHQAKPNDIPMGQFGAYWIDEGRLLLSYTEDEVVVWGIVPENQRRIIHPHTAPINDLHIGSGMFATASVDGSAKLFDFGGNQIGSLSAGFPLSTIELREDINRAVTCSTSGNITLWDITAGEKLWEVNIPGTGVARLSPDGNRVVVGPRADIQHNSLQISTDGHLLSGNSGEITASFISSGLPWYGEIFGDNFFVVQDIKNAHVHDTGTGRLINSFVHDTQGTGTAAILSKGGIIYHSHSGRFLFHSETGERFFPIYNFAYLPRFIIPSPVDESTYLSVCFFNTVMFNHIYSENETGIRLDYPRRHFEAISYQHPGLVVGASFSHNGLYAISISIDGTVAIINEAGLLWLIENEESEAPLVEAGFSPDDEQIILVYESGKVKIYTFQTLETIREKARRLINERL